MAGSAATWAIGTGGGSAPPGCSATPATKPAQTQVLLQRRSWWSSHGGTWGLFGGARQRDESATAAALREAAEECTLPGDMVRIRGCRA